MVKINEILDYLKLLLAPEKFNDYCPNGLQVAGKTSIQKIITGVSACQALLNAAVSYEADAILVHNGYFWQGESPVVTGMKQRRLATLLKNDINLIAYHLPLDAHHEVGNNAQLASLLDWQIEGTIDIGQTPSFAFYGSLARTMSGDELAAHIAKKLGRMPLHISAGSKKITTIGWCSGGAQQYIDAAADQQLDAYLTGEVSEQTVHIARERGIDFFAAGHHATERYGIQALGEHIAQRFSLDVKFVDIDNPV